MQRLAEEKDCLAKNCHRQAGEGDTRKGAITFEISKRDHVTASFFLDLVRYVERIEIKNTNKPEFISITSR